MKIIASRNKREGRYLINRGLIHHRIMTWLWKQSGIKNTRAAYFGGGRPIDVWPTKKPLTERRFLIREKSK